MTKTNQIVTIVYDYEKGKLRAQHNGNWVRFPNHLRVRGASYIVEKLTEGRSGSWNATGQIKLIQSTTPVSYR